MFMDSIIYILKQHEEKTVMMKVMPIEAQIKPFIFLILLISLLSLNIIYSKANENIGNKREIRCFKGMLISFMIYCLVDLRLLIGERFYSIFPKLFVLFVVSIGFAAMSCACFFWFLYVYSDLHIAQKSSLKNKINIWGIIIHIPVLIDLFILFTPMYVFVYEIKDGVAYFKPLINLILIIDYIYLIAATGISIFNKKRAKTKSEKKKYNSQILFILFFTVSGFLIGFLMNLPAIELCVIPVVLKIFVELQDSQIYTDALTKLYNRRRMTEFINDGISTCSKEDPLTIIMIDMDYFKSINDILGHDEGDKALIYFSKSLGHMLLNKSAVAARWGGDEFVVCGKEKELSEKFRQWLQEELETNNELSYVPQFSSGFYKCTSPNKTSEQVLVYADAALYKDKEERHKIPNNFVSKLIAIKNGTVS